MFTPPPPRKDTLGVVNRVRLKDGGLPLFLFIVAVHIISLNNSGTRHRADIGGVTGLVEHPK